MTTELQQQIERDDKLVNSLLKGRAKPPLKHALQIKIQEIKQKVRSFLPKRKGFVSSFKSLSDGED